MVGADLNEIDNSAVRVHLGLGRAPTVYSAVAIS
jgi:hypothetical protein